MSFSIRAALFLVLAFTVAGCNKNPTSTSGGGGTPTPVATATGPITCTDSSLEVCVGHTGGTAPVVGYSNAEGQNIGGLSNAVVFGNTVSNLYYNPSDDSVTITFDGVDPGQGGFNTLTIGGHTYSTTNAIYKSGSWRWVGVGGNPFGGDSGNVLFSVS